MLVVFYNKWGFYVYVLETILTGGRKEGEREGKRQRETETENVGREEGTGERPGCLGKLDNGVLKRFSLCFGYPGDRLYQKL